MTTINLKSNIDAFQKKVSDAAYKQIPFASAQALSALGKLVAAAEQRNEVKVLDRPRPFTQNAIGVIRASKDRQAAVVFMKDITARYLAPYEFGGRNALNSKALLKPIDAAGDLDQYGNLPRNFLAKLKGRKDIFIGAVKTKSGIVNGVWQRSVGEGVKAVSVVRINRKGEVRIGKTAKGINTSGKLKLLVKFDDAHPVRQHLDWFGVAQDTVSKNFNREMGKALAKAIATAR